MKTMTGHDPEPFARNDNRKPLAPGTIVIDGSGLRYVIKEGKVGRGGSALIYRAAREGNLRNFILKELYPRSREFEFVRKNMVVNAEDEKSKAELEIVRENMIRESEIGQRISKATGRTLGAWETLNAVDIIVDGKRYDGAGSFFIVLEEANDDDKKRGWFLHDLLRECAKPIKDGEPLRNGGMPAPVIAARIMEELLKSLRDIHRAGYIHGDINDANFFLMGPDPSTNDIGVGQLLDFGCAFKLEADGMTAPIENVFSSFGYSSPEIVEHEGALRLTPATDIFSAGALMLYLFKGMDYKNNCGDDLVNGFSIDITVSQKRLLKSGYRFEAAMLFRKILSKALEYYPEDRYANAEEMLKDINFLVKLIDPPRFTLPRNLSRSPYFVRGSRDEELKSLQAALDEGTHPLWIWGLGGLGKTELAMEFARRQIENGRAAYMVTFKHSILETVMSMEFSGWYYEFDGRGDALEGEYRARLNILKDHYRDALLIIDNFDPDEGTLADLMSEPAYKDLLGLGMHVLFTTRSRPNEAVEEIKALNEEDAMSLFKNIMGKIPSEDEETIRKMIREVEGHTMTVDILARTLKEAWGTLSAEELLNRLKNGRLDASSLPEVKHRKAMTERELRIYGHLRVLFNLINLDEDYREILCDLTLIPPDGFDAAEFILSESGRKKKQLKKLERGGWVRRQTESNLLCIHPLIRSVFKNELKPGNDDCRAFLSALWSRLEDRYPPNETLLDQASEMYRKAAMELGDKTGEHHFHASCCYMRLRNFYGAYTHAKKALDIQRTLMPDPDHRLAQAYLMAGSAQLFMRCFQDMNVATECIESAFKIYEEIAPESLEFAEACAAMSMLHEIKGAHDESVRLAKRALGIFETAPIKNKFMMARVSKAAGDFDKALSYGEEAIELNEGARPKPFIELAQAQSLVGEVYKMLWDKTHIAVYLHRSNKVLRQSYVNINVAMMKPTLRLLRHAQEHKDNNELVKRYRVMADSCRVNDQLDEAEEYILKSMGEIQPGKTEPIQIFLTYFSASQIYTARKEYKTALHYAEKSRAEYLKAHPDDSEHFLETEDLNIRNIRAEMPDKKRDNIPMV